MVTPLPMDPFSGVRSFVAPRRQALLGLASGLLQGNDWGQGLGMGFERAAMGRQADDAYAQSLQAEQERQAQINKTAEFLRKQGAVDWADAIEAGMIDSKTAFQGWRDESKAKGPIKASAGDVFLDPETMQPMYSVPDPKAQADVDQTIFGREKDLTSQYSQQDPVKTYQAVRNGYERVRASAQTNSGPGDISMIFAYMKMLDPTSVVREGEFATAENAGGVGAQISNLYNRLLSGERLTPELRQQFLSAADALYSETSQNLEALNEQYSGRSDAWGVDPRRFMTTPEVYQPIMPPSPGGNWVDAGGGYKVRPK